MGYRDSLGAARTQMEQLEAENRELRVTLERQRSASAEARPARIAAAWPKISRSRAQVIERDTLTNAIAAQNANLLMGVLWLLALPPCFVVMALGKMGAIAGIIVWAVFLKDLSRRSKQSLFTCPCGFQVRGRDTERFIRNLRCPECDTTFVLSA
jgi:hypothetical protein